MEIFLESGYQEASMRKIAAKAGITAGAIYKHFSGKEEMFDELFEASGQKLMGITESMMDIDFSTMPDDKLIGILYSRVSIRTIQLLEGDIRLLHMLLKNDTGKCLEKFRDIYVERSAGFAFNHYEALYKSGFATTQPSTVAIYLLSSAEFSMACEIIADDACQDGIPQEMKKAFMEAMDILLYGLKAELEITNITKGDIQ